MCVRIKFKFSLLNVALLLQTDYLMLLMKQPIDNLVATDQQLQAFFNWVSLKSHAVSVDYKPVTMRAFYFDLALARALGLVGGTLNLARAFNCSLTCNLERHLALDLALDRALGLKQVVALSVEPNIVFERVLERALAHARVLDPMLERALLKLKEQMPDKVDTKKFNQWWSDHGGNWTEQLRAVTIKYRNLGHNWQFSEKQREALKQYKDANLILVNCLNSYCCITNPLRSEILETLLLPIAEMRVPHVPEWS